MKVEEGTKCVTMTERRDGSCSHSKVYSGKKGKRKNRTEGKTENRQNIYCIPDSYNTLKAFLF